MSMMIDEVEEAIETLSDEDLYQFFHDAWSKVEAEIDMVMLEKRAKAVEQALITTPGVKRVGYWKDLLTDTHTFNICLNDGGWKMIGPLDASQILDSSKDAGVIAAEGYLKSIS